MVTSSTTTKQDVSLPLISALAVITPPWRDLPGLLRCFRSQTYRYKELIVINNAQSSWIAAGLIPIAEPNVIYVDAPGQMTAGSAYSLALSLANGQLVAHFEPKEWHHPDRLASQATRLRETGTDVCCLSGTLLAVGNTVRTINAGRYGAAATVCCRRPQGIDYGRSQRGPEVTLLGNLLTNERALTLLDRPELVVTVGSGKLTTRGCVERSTVIRAVRDWSVRSLKDHGLGAPA